jgi:GntR family transcriptional regulator
MALGSLSSAVQSSGTGIPEGGKARRVYLSMKGDIARGAFGVGESLPGEHKLAAQYDVSRVTVRRALDALAEDGLIEKRAGSGSIIKAPEPGSQSIKADIATLMPQLANMGAKSEARLLSFSYEPATAAISSALDLVSGALVQRAVRVRHVEGRAFSYLVTYVPEAVAASYSEADLATRPLYQLLEEGGIEIGSAQQSVSASLATPDVAAALDVPVGSALIALDRLVCDSQGRGVEFLSALYRPDRFQLSMSLERVGDGKNRHWEPTIALEPALPAKASL